MTAHIGSPVVDLPVATATYGEVALFTWTAPDDHPAGEHTVTVAGASGTVTATFVVPDGADTPATLTIDRASLLIMNGVADQGASIVVRTLGGDVVDEVQADMNGRWYALLL